MANGQLGAEDSPATPFRPITPRYTAAEVEKAVEPLRQRIAELEAQLKVQN